MRYSSVIQQLYRQCHHTGFLRSDHQLTTPSPNLQACIPDGVVAAAKSSPSPNVVYQFAIPGHPTLVGKIKFPYHAQENLPNSAITYCLDLFTLQLGYKNPGDMLSSTETKNNNQVDSSITPTTVGVSASLTYGLATAIVQGLESSVRNFRINEGFYYEVLHNDYPSFPILIAFGSITKHPVAPPTSRAYLST